MPASLLIGLKNNLDYTRHVYAHTRRLYPTLEIVLVSYNSIDGTHAWLDELADPYVRYYYDTTDRTLSDTYNKAIELATGEYVIFAHNDMVLAPGFIEALAVLQAPDRVVCYTTVEPPVFADDPRPGKIVRDFGTDPETFQGEAFTAFARGQQRQQELTGQHVADRAQPSFFLCAARALLLELGGLDPLFAPMFCEDDDLLLRLRLHGLTTVVSLDAICYHFVSKTSRFSAEYRALTRQIEGQSNRNFVRKWGFRPNGPVQQTYDIGLVVPGADQAVLHRLEPWCRTLYTDADTEAYRQAEQPATAIDLRTRLKPLHAPRTNGVLVTGPARRLQRLTDEQLATLPAVLHSRISQPRSGLSQLLARLFPTFRWQGLRIRIANPATTERNLIRKPLTL